MLSRLVWRTTAAAAWLGSYHVHRVAYATKTQLEDIRSSRCFGLAISDSFLYVDEMKGRDLLRAADAPSYGGVCISNVAVQTHHGRQI